MNPPLPDWRRRFLFLDIETAPHRVYTWGLFGQNVSIDQIEEPGYTLCWAAKWHGAKNVMFDSVEDGDTERMLKGIYDLIREADAVIHYNGSKFDMPTLQGEFLKFGYQPPPPYKQIDLLQTARKKFRLPSNKLDYVARHLGITGKVKHKGMELWTACMAGDPAAWRVMKKYNIQDVRLLANVYERFLPWIVEHPHAGAFDPDMRGLTCQTCGSGNLIRQGYKVAKTGRYQQFRCGDCGSWMRHRLRDKDEPPMKLVGTA